MDQRLKKHPLGFSEIAAKPTSQELQYYADKYYQVAKGSYVLGYTNDELLYFRANLEQRSMILQHHLSSLSSATVKLGIGRNIAAFLRPLGPD
jgi:hypothetical protein